MMCHPCEISVRLHPSQFVKGVEKNAIFRVFVNNKSRTSQVRPILAVLTSAIEGSAKSGRCADVLASVKDLLHRKCTSVTPHCDGHFADLDPSPLRSRLLTPFAPSWVAELERSWNNSDNRLLRGCSLRTRNRSCQQLHVSRPKVAIGSHGAFPYTTCLLQTPQNVFEPNGLESEW